MRVNCGIIPASLRCTKTGYGNFSQLPATEFAGRIAGIARLIEER
jgi:hypothetical protein